MLQAISFKWSWILVGLLIATSVGQNPCKPNDPCYVIPVAPNRSCNNSATLTSADQLLKEKKWAEALQLCAGVVSAACNNAERHLAVECLKRSSAIAADLRTDPTKSEPVAKCCPPNIEAFEKKSWFNGETKKSLDLLSRMADWLEYVGVRLKGNSFWSTCMGIVPAAGWQRFTWVLVMLLIAVLVILILWIIPYNLALLATTLLRLASRYLPLLSNFIHGPKWVVWSIQDEGKTGAAGAVMDALNHYANPLLREMTRQIQEERLDAGMEPIAIERPSLLLKPPLSVPNSQLQSLSHGAWKNFLSSIPRDDKPALPEECNSFVVERFVRLNVEQSVSYPEFSLDTVLAELDITIGKFALKGISQLYQLYKRYLSICRPYILGTVSQTEKDGQKVWSVRLNASRVRFKGFQIRRETFSVFADSQPQEYGDPLLLVAQRAALRLVIRIRDSEMKANEAIARTSFQQGVQQIKQLV